MVKNYRLKDLDCANCAMKIGNAVSSLSGVKEAKVHFAAQQMTVEFAVDAGADLENAIFDAVRAIEPGTQVLPFAEQTSKDVHQEEELKRRGFSRSFIAMGVCVLILAAGIF
jgi:Cd2+/Zn2+-exporting ATPase